MAIQHKLILSFAFLLTSIAVVHAQGGLPDENVSIIKDFDARLLESAKIQVSPSLPVLDTATKRQDYIIPAKPAVVNYAKPSFRPVGVRSAGTEEVYNGYVKAGGGIPTSLYGEAGYFLNVEDRFNGKLWFRHHSANNKALENQRFFNNDFLANGNIYLNEKTVVEAKAGYSYDRVHFFGYDHDSLEFDPEAVRQDYKILDLGARLFNAERNDIDLNYFVSPNVYFMNDFFSNKETGVDLNMGVTKWFAEQHPLKLVFRTDFTTYEDTAKQNLNNFYIQPSFAFHAEFLRIKIGGNFASNRDVFYVFPDAEITLRIFGDGFQIFGGATGDLRKNTFRSIATYNPFVQIRGTELLNTQWRNYYAGLKGNLGWLNYSAQLGYGNATDLALFQANFTNIGITRFGVVYDTVDVFNIQGNATLSPAEGLTISGSFSSSVFDPRNEEKAWGLPNIEGNFSAIYKLLEGKAQLKGNLYVADQITYRDALGEAQQTNALLDLSVGGSYYFTDNIGIFLDINNLLNNRRERWKDYPIFGLNILGGITARF